jgi:hypothetical protein
MSAQPALLVSFWLAFGVVVAEGPANSGMTTLVFAYHSRRFPTTEAMSLGKMPQPFPADKQYS